MKKSTTVSSVLRDQLSVVPRKTMTVESALHKLVSKKPPEWSADRMQNKQVTTISGAIRDFNLSRAATNDWTKFLEEVVYGATEVVLRQQVMQKLKEQGWPQEARKEMFRRAIELHRNRQQKSFRLRTPSQLRKAEARGGSYHRRVPAPRGGYRYFYDQEKYNNSKTAHHAGEDMTKKAVSSRVMQAIESSGDAGCSGKELSTLAKKYGRKVVAGVLRERCGDSGDLLLKDGRVYKR